MLVNTDTIFLASNFISGLLFYTAVAPKTSQHIFGSSIVMSHKLPIWFGLDGVSFRLATCAHRSVNARQISDGLYRRSSLRTFNKASMADG